MTTSPILATHTGDTGGVAGKCKKRGRNKKYCTRYRLESKREINKLHRLMEHITRHPSDSSAKAAIEWLKKILPVSTYRPIIASYRVVA